jgi:hypothetical protein
MPCSSLKVKDVSAEHFIFIFRVEEETNMKQAASKENSSG